LFQRRAIISTTHKGRDHIVISKEALEELVEQVNAKPLPINVGHDNRRLIGYTSDAKLVQLKNGVFGVEATMNIFETDEELAEFLPLVEKMEIESGYVEFDDGRVVRAEKMKDRYCEGYLRRDILRDIFPRIEEFLDEDSLFLVISPESLHLFGIKVGNQYVMYHPYLRRFHSRQNSYNIDFIKRLIEIHKKSSQMVVKVGIDFDFVGIVGTERKYVERDYWYGPKFNRKNIKNIPDGVTVHGLKNESKEYNQIRKTDFFWHTKKDIKTLEIEEIVNNAYPLDLDVKKGFPARYIHSEYDLKKEKFVHIDGAVRVYTDVQWNNRRNKDIDKISKEMRRVKLFRIDHELDFPDWLKLVHYFFRGNEHIVEYFSS
jgi:hypothetical protein